MVTSDLEKWTTEHRIPSPDCGLTGDGDTRQSSVFHVRACQAQGREDGEEPKWLTWTSVSFASSQRAVQAKKVQYFKIPGNRGSFLLLACATPWVWWGGGAVDRKEGGGVSLWPVRVRSESLPEGKMLPNHGVRVSRTQGGSPWELLILWRSPVGEGAMVKVVSSLRTQGPRMTYSYCLVAWHGLWVMRVQEVSISLLVIITESRGPRLSLHSGALERPSPDTDTHCTKKQESCTDSCLE